MRGADADAIDALLAQHGLGCVTVHRAGLGKVWDPFAWQGWDREELCASPWEAWVPVRIMAPTAVPWAGIVSGIGAADAILVWENSNGRQDSGWVDRVRRVSQRACPGTASSAPLISR